MRNPACCNSPHFQVLVQNRTDRWFWNIQSLSKLSNNDVTIFSNHDSDCIHHLLCANAQRSSNMGSNAVVSLSSEKAAGWWKIVKSPSRSSSVYASCINFTVSATDFFNRQQNFIALFCSFFKSIFESSTFTKIAVTRQWKVISRWDFDHWCRISITDHATLLGCALQWAVLPS